MSRTLSFTSLVAISLLILIFFAAGAAPQPATNAPPVITKAAGPAVWEPVAIPKEAADLQGLDIDSKGVIYLGDNHTGFWNSTDFGKTWKQINGEGESKISLPILNAWEIGVDPADDNHLVASTGNPRDKETKQASNKSCYFWNSVDGGKTWTKIAGYQMGWYPGNSRAVFAANGNICFGGLWDSQKPPVYLSTDKGKTCAPAAMKPFNGGAIGMGRNPSNGDIWMGIAEEDPKAQSGGVYVSRDNGKSYEMVNPFPKHGNFTQFEFTAKGDVLAVNDHGILKSSDGGKTWKDSWKQNVGAEGWAIGHDDTPNRNLYFSHMRPKMDTPAAQVFKDLVLRSTDGGETWQAWDAGIPYPSSLQIYATHFSQNPGDGKMYASFRRGGGLYRTIEALTRPATRDKK